MKNFLHGLGVVSRCIPRNNLGGNKTYSGTRSWVSCPSKHTTFIEHLYNAGPTSKTLDQHCINVVQIFVFVWVLWSVKVSESTSYVAIYMIWFGMLTSLLELLSLWQAWCSERLRCSWANNSNCLLFKLLVHVISLCYAFAPRYRQRQAAVTAYLKRQQLLLPTFTPNHGVRYIQDTDTMLSDREETSNISVLM